MSGAQFVPLLKEANITNPDLKVLKTIAFRYPNQLLAAVSSGLPEVCANLYETAQELPNPSTLRTIQQKLQANLVNDELSLAQPDILYGIDLVARENIVIKLLRVPETTPNSTTTLSPRKRAVLAEEEAWKRVADANVEGLVKCEYQRLEVEEHTDETEEPKTIVTWVALKMPHYVSSLADRPQFPEDLLQSGFHRILKALKGLHAVNLVHMDVKPRNVLVDYKLGWHLADLGSAHKIGETVWSFTPSFNPYKIHRQATAILEMDLVQLCVLIAVEREKSTWRARLCCGKDDDRVDSQRVLQQLQMIGNEEFREEVTNLFKESLDVVKRHLGVPTIRASIDPRWLKWVQEHTKNLDRPGPE
ncbi:hypothetical protein HK102_001672 [Quaeritorhiza haematococci]|nr:hypothetical protein HK102_001672 [Quaeritorhiza haematococci]